MASRRDARGAQLFRSAGWRTPRRHRAVRHTFRNLVTGGAIRRATVMGLGLFGGGLAAARFLAAHGIHVTVTDLRAGEVLAESIDRLPPGCRLVLGRHEPGDFSTTDLVVASPAVKPDSEWLAMAGAEGVPIETEMSLFMRFCRGRCVGVTGSNGKTTTAHLLAAMLERSGLATRMGGNMGISLLEEVERIAEEDRVVLELSSFQLHGLGERDLGPDGAVVLNITPNHLDWHPGMAHYVEAKRQILRFAEWGVLNAEDDRLKAWGDPVMRLSGAPRILFFGGTEGEADAWEDGGVLHLAAGAADTVLIGAEEVPLPGRCNRLNVLAAALAARQEGAGTEAIADAVRDFRPVRHRLEKVASVRGVGFWDDSVSTTPESTRAAIDAFPPRRAVFLIGGRDKGCALGDLLEQLARSAAGIVFMGEVASTLARRYRALSIVGSAPVAVAGDLRAAVGAAWRMVPDRGDVVLSPGYPSYDWFRNYVDRGEQFGALVRGLTTAGQSVSQKEKEKGPDAESQGESCPVR